MNKAEWKAMEAEVAVAAAGTGWAPVKDPAQLISVKEASEIVAEYGELAKQLVAYSDKFTKRTEGWLWREFSTEAAAKLFLRRLTRAFEPLGRGLAKQGPVETAEGKFLVQVKARKKRGTSEGVAEAMSEVPAAT